MPTNDSEVPAPTRRDGAPLLLKELLIAAAAVALAIGARWLLGPVMGDRAVYLFAIGAASVLGWLVRPAVFIPSVCVALLLSLMLFAEPFGVLSLPDAAATGHLVVATALAAGVAATSWYGRRTRNRALSAAAEAARSTDLLRAVSQATDDLIYVKDAQGRLLLANPATLRAIGLSAEAVLGRTEAEWASNPAQAATMQSNDRAVLESGRTVSAEETFTGPEGTRIYHSQKQPLRDASGRVVGLVGISRDITERRESEDAARVGERRLALALEAGDLGLWDWQIPTGEVHYGGRWAAMLGYDAHEIEPHLRAWERLVHPEDLGRAERAVADHLEGRTALYECEHRLRHKDGSWRWVMARGRVVERGPEGRPLRIIGVHGDVTSRKRAHDALRESEARFRNMADHAPVMIWITGPDGRSIYLSQSWCDHTGLTLEQGLGFGWLDTVHPEDRAGAEAVFLKAVEAQEAFRIEYRLRRSDGSYSWVIDSARPRLGAGGEFLGYIGSVLDISDRMEAEAALRRSEERYRTLFNSLDQGFCIAEMIFDDQGRPADYRIIEGNPAFAEFTGLRDWGRGTVLELMPELERWWIETYGRIALSGEPEQFENYAAPMGKWFEVYAFRFGDPARRQVAIFFKDITQRKRTQEALAEAHRRIDSALIAGEVGTFEWDILGDRLSGDENFARMFGIELDASGAAPIADYFAAVHPDDRAEVSERVSRTIQTGCAYEAEYRIINGGRTRWVIARGMGEQDESGRTVYFPGVVLDITARKEAEEAQRRAVEQYERQVRLFEGIASTTPDFVYIFDVQGRFQYANRRLLEVWGMSLPEIVGRTCRELGYEQWHHDMHMREIAQVIRTKAPIKGEVPFQAPLTGVFGIYEYIFTPVIGPDGEVELIAGTTRDVTERKHAEDALRTSEERYRLVSRATNDVIWDWDLRTNRLYWNDAVREHFGCTREEIGPMISGWYDRIHPDDHERILSGIHEAIDGGKESWTDEYRFRKSDGSYASILDRGYIARDADGRPFRMIGSMVDLTERRLAEERLSESESRFRLLADAMPQIVWSTRADGYHDYFNDRWYDYTGMPRPGEPGGEHDPAGAGQGWFWKDYLHPDDYERTVERWANSLATGEPYSVEYRFRRKDGIYRWFIGRALPLRNDAGTITRWFGTCTDVEDAKATEEALRQSESFYRQTIESIPGMVFTNTPDGACDYVSAPWVEFTGVAAEHHLGDGWLRSLHPDDRELAFSAWRSAVEGRGGFDVDYRVRRSDGEYEWFKVRGRAIRDAAGNVVRWFGTAVNVHDLMTARDALRRSEGRFRGIAETTPDIIFTTRPDGSCDYANTRFYEYTGAPPGSAEGFGWLAPVHPDDGEHTRSAWDSCIAAEQPLETECRLRAADGSYRWFSIRAHPVRDVGGRIVQWAGCCSDIHDAKAAQEVLAGVNERLNAAVVAKTAELERSYRALRVSERMASLGTFAAGMGHDLANLLLPVRTRLEELQMDESLSETARSDIRAVGGSMAHIQSLCRGLRLFAMDPESEAEGFTALPGWAADLERVLRTALPGTIELDIRVPADLPPASIAPHRLSQAVLNLVQNARDAILDARDKDGNGELREGLHARKGRIEIGAARESLGGADAVRLWVKDDGPGMSEEVRSRCMEPFYTTRTRGLGGTGLGLSIVHGIVSKAGGRMEIESSPGRGTTTSLLLPLTPSPQAAPPPAESGPSPGRPRAAVSLADGRAAAFATSVLSSMGFAVRVPGTAEEVEEATDLWVTDASPEAFTAAGRLLDKRRRPDAPTERRPAVVVLGGDDRWSGLGATTLRREAPLSDLKRTLETLVAPASP